MTFSYEATKSKEARLPYVCPKCGLQMLDAGRGRPEVGKELVRHLKAKHSDSLGKAILIAEPTTDFEFNFLQPDGTGRWLIIAHGSPWMISTMIVADWRVEWYEDGAHAPVNP